MEQIITIQPIENLNQRRRLSVIMVCSIIALLLVGGTIDFVWTVNLKFKPAYSMYMDFRVTEISMIQLLDEYDVFRNEAPQDPTTWEESEHVRNGLFNLAVKELQNKYMRKILAYNHEAKEISDFMFAIGCKINQVEIPKKIILSRG